MHRNLIQSVSALTVSLALGFFAIHQSARHQNQTKGAQNRMPQSSVNEIYNLLSQIEKDLDNPAIFNPQTAVSYIKNLTESAYELETKDIYPDSAAEKAQFAQTRKDWMDRLFGIQIKLRDKMHEFHERTPLTTEQVAAFRNGNMYLSYAQDLVLMEWNMYQDVVAKPVMFENEFPITQRNPNLKDFSLLPGDIILVRGGSFVSATIARSGDYLSNFSHVAMVIQDPKGNLSVGEALMEEGLITYSVDKYQNLERLSRAIVLRSKDQSMAKRAALEAWKIVDQDLKSPVRRMFDMMMNPDSHEKIYCFEFVRMSYIRATNGAKKIPQFPMPFKKALKGNSFYQGMGNTLEVGAAPDDAFFETGFDIVMTHRDVSQIKKDWAFDVAMSSIFEFIDGKYDYKKDIKAGLTAKIADFMKNVLKIPMKQVPPGIASDAIQLILEHKNITTELQTHLMKQMEADARPIAYKQLEVRAKEWLESNKSRFFVPCGERNKGGMCKSYF